MLPEATSPPLPTPTVVYTLPCVHEGSVVEYCKTCRGALSERRHVRVCLHPNPSDPDRDLCTRTYVSDRVQACDRCPDRRAERNVPSFFRRYDRDNLAAGIRGGYRFNSSIMPWKDGYILAFRTGWAGSEIYVVRLDDEFEPDTCSAVRLDLNTAGSGYGREDPRLFLYRGVPHIAFAGVEGAIGKVSHTNVLYARLRPDSLTVDRVFYPRYEKRQKWEKNWAWFEHEDSIYAVYTFSPSVRVLRVDGEKAVIAHETPNNTGWVGGQIRGGASPVLVGDELWCFFHDRVEINRHRIYRTGLLTLDAFPPFGVRRLVPDPVLTADPETKPADQYASVVFAGGAVRDGDWWVVSHGVHDRWTELHRWKHADLESRLTEVRK